MLLLAHGDYSKLFLIFFVLPISLISITSLMKFKIMNILFQINKGLVWRVILSTLLDLLLILSILDYIFHRNMSSLIMLIFLSIIYILIQSLILFSEKFKNSILPSYKISLSLFFLLVNPTIIITVLMNALF